MNYKIRLTIYSMLCMLVLALLGKLILDHPQDIYERWLAFRLRNQHIVISLTTTPHRIDQIQDTLQLIYAQNVPYKAIYINIPYVFKRDNLEYKIPVWLQNDKRLTILRTEDYGPATKILGVLKNVNLPNDAIIISLDDDVTYPKNTALYLAYKAMLNPGYAIGLSGVNIDIDSADGLFNIDQNDAFTSALQGVAGIAYRRYFFDDTIFDIVNAPRECINSDDLYISFYLAKHNIPRQMLKNKYLNLNSLKTKDLGRMPDALRHQCASEAERHRVCIAYMQQHAPEVKF